MPDSFGMTGTPGANFGGTNVAVPSGPASSQPSIGGTTNPMVPNFPSGQAFPANTAGTQPTGLGNFNISDLLGGGYDSDHYSSFQHAMKDAGYSWGVADQLWRFLSSGAGFNPQVAQAMINFLQPQVHRGEMDILEQFSSRGLRNSSPAAIGLGDFLSQVNLNEQEIFAQMYQQAVQNYLTVLLAGKKTDGSSSLAGLGALAGGAGSILSGIGSLGKN